MTDQIDGGQVLDVNEIIYNKSITRDDMINFQINEIRLAINNIVSDVDLEKIKRMLKALEILQFGKTTPQTESNLAELSKDYINKKAEAKDEEEELSIELNFIFKKFSELVELIIERGKFGEIDGAMDLTKHKEKKDKKEKARKETKTGRENVNNKKGR